MKVKTDIASKDMKKNADHTFCFVMGMLKMQISEKEYKYWDCLDIFMCDIGQIVSTGVSETYYSKKILYCACFWSILKGGIENIKYKI